MTKYDYITKNIGEVKKMCKNGLLSSTILKDYDVVKKYNEYSHIKSKMLRYQIVADEMRLSCNSVRKTVSEMQKKFKV